MAHVVNAGTVGSGVTFIDIFSDGRYVFTLRYNYPPLFRIDLNNVYEKVLEKRPTLKGRKLEMIFD